MYAYHELAIPGGIGFLIGAVFMYLAFVPKKKGD